MTDEGTAHLVGVMDGVASHQTIIHKAAVLVRGIKELRFATL